MDERYSERIRPANTEQKLALLTVQLSPIMDRLGRVLTDLAHMIEKPVSRDETFQSHAVREITNAESRNIPSMPSQAELYQREPDIDIHIHAVFVGGLGDSESQHSR